MDIDGSDGNGGTPKRPRPEVARETKAYPRKRALKACGTCRMRKTKCNNERPVCGFCQSLGAVCMYDDTAHDISTLDPASQLIVDRLDQLLQRVDQDAAESSKGFRQVLHRLGQIALSSGPGQGFLGPAFSNEADATAPLQEADIHLIEDENMLTPASQTSPDAVLDWPIFGNQFQWGYITDSLFTEGMARSKPAIVQKSSTSNFGSTAAINEEAIPRLVEVFLSRVHTKCPVLDIELARNYARDVAQDGLRWTGPSCLTLIMSALGCIASPFSDLYSSRIVHDKKATSSSLHSTSLLLGKLYYDAACKRIGLLESNILSTQCIFLCGVYEMYMLSPLKAWQWFSSASSTLYTHLRCEEVQSKIAASGTKSLDSQRLEASIYWSAYKSIELRTELPLPPSLLADVKYSHALPTPPPNLGSRMDIEDSASPIFQATPESFSQLQGMEVSSDKMQEQAWFLYLTDIILSRLGTRVLLNLYDHGHHFWSQDHLHIMLRAADEFELQLSDWFSTLPEPIQFDDFEIRPSHELRFVVQFRALEVKSWLYRPFLYYTIHHAPYDTLNPRLQSLVLKAIDSSIHWILLRPARHRHHGSWYAGRLVLSSALSIIAAVKAGIEAEKLSDWRDIVLEAISAMEFWEDESPDFRKGREVLELYYAQLGEQ
ncbi:hypothetical protein DL98DRAFT_504778 [Cadophora sp. DSE1049]|nr:hypothetical protein DL98DRAFT_504778 [Cadophora sp. DSE1049]